MSFESPSAILEVVERTLIRVGVPPNARADKMVELRARLYHGFLAGHCPVCDSVIAVIMAPDMPPELAATMYGEAWCERCGPRLITEAHWTRLQYENLTD